MVLKVISLNENNRFPTQQEVFENMCLDLIENWKLRRWISQIAVEVSGLYT